MEIRKATTKQLQAIHAILHKRAILHHKKDIISSYTEGRCESSSDLTFAEAGMIISHLLSKKVPNDEEDKKTKMLGKLFAQAHEMGWISVDAVVGADGKMKPKKDYSKVYGWVEKYGYLKKPLRSYTYNELPKLISQFEFKIYNPYISNLK